MSWNTFVQASQDDEEKKRRERMANGLSPSQNAAQDNSQQLSGWDSFVAQTNPQQEKKKTETPTKKTPKVQKPEQNVNQNNSQPDKKNGIIDKVGGFLKGILNKPKSEQQANLDRVNELVKTVKPIKKQDEALKKAYMQFPSFVANPDIKVNNQEATLTKESKKAAMKFWSAPVDESINAARDFLTYHPKALQTLADIQTNIETYPGPIGDFQRAQIATVTKTFFGSSQAVQDAFDKPLYKPVTIEGKVASTVGQAIGSVLAFEAAGSAVKALNAGKATLPIIFATLGQTSLGPDADIIKRVGRIPFDAYFGHLFSLIPGGATSVKEAATSVGKAAGFGSIYTGLDAIANGEKDKNKIAQDMATGAITFGLFHLVGASIGLLDSTVLASKTRTGSDVFSPSDLRQIANRKGVAGTKLADDLLNLSTQAEAQGKDISINMEAMKKSVISDKLNLKKPEGVKIDAQLVDRAKEIPTTEQKPVTDPNTPSNNVPEIIKSEITNTPKDTIKIPTDIRPAEQSSFKQLEQEKATIADTYVQKFGNVIDPDKAKELFTGYTKEKASDFHRASTVVRDLVYDKLIEEKKADPNAPGAIKFTAGGPAAGKSEAIGKIDPNDYSIVMDTSFSHNPTSEKVLSKALNNGFGVNIDFVYADPKAAWDRAKLRGREVPIESFANYHASALENIKKTYEKYKDNPDVNFTFYDNSGESGQAKIVNFDFIKNISYTKDELLQQLKAYEKNDTSGVQEIQRGTSTENTSKPQQRDVEKVSPQETQDKVIEVQSLIYQGDEAQAKKLHTASTRGSNKRSSSKKQGGQGGNKATGTGSQVKNAPVDESQAKNISSFNVGDTVRDIYDGAMYEIGVTKRNGVATIKNLDTGKVSEMNANNNRRYTTVEKKGGVNASKDSGNYKISGKNTIASSPEDLRNKIDQLNKFAQANALLRRTGGIKNRKAVGQFVADSTINKAGEIRLKPSYIKSDADYVAVLAHETGHAIQNSVAGSIDSNMYSVFGDVDTQTIDTIRDELIAITNELEGKDTVSKNSEYYMRDSELFARFIEKMMVSPSNLEEIAPTTLDHFEKMQISNPIIREFLEAANGEIDKGASTFKPLGDLREMYQKHLGKRVGNIAFDEEIVHRAMQERAKISVEKLIKDKFKDVKDDPTVLFRAAESIKITRDGVPEFGTRDFAKPQTKAEEQRLIDSGWEHVGMQVQDGKDVPMYARQRYSKDEAKRIFEQLSPQGKKLIKEFTAARDEAKDYFNREVIKQVNGIESDIEGWVHHYFDPNSTMKTGLNFRKKTAAARLKRMGAEGYIEDFQKAMTKAITELEGEKVFNDFIQRQFARVTRPLPDGAKPDPGWIEVVGNVEKGVGTRAEKKVVVIKDGKSFIPKQSRYQMPKDIYKRYEMWRGVVDEASAATKVVNNINRYWRINILAHPGTASTNLFSGGIQYTSKILTDFYTEVLTGNVEMKKTKKNIGAIIKTLMPKGWVDAPDWIYGGDMSNYYGQFKTRGKSDKLIDVYADKTLKLFSAYERYWKKTIALSEGVQDLKSLNKMGKEGLRLPTKEERELIASINREIDLYAYDYDNIPTALDNFRKSTAGTAIKPFTVYPYKYAKHILNMTTSIFDRSIPWQIRIAKLLSLATMVAAYAHFSEERKKEQQTPESDAEIPVRYSPKGRLFMGERDGKELFTRVAKYPFFNLTNAGMDVVNGRYESAIDLVSEMLGSIGPVGKLALLGIGYRSKYEQYESAPVIIGNTVSTYFPLSRVLNDASRYLDPFQRKQKTFSQTFTNMIPTTDKDLQNKLHGEIRTERIPIINKSDGKTKSTRTTYDQALINYRDDILLSLLSGIYISRIDPDDAKAFIIRKEQNEQNQKRSEVIDQHVERYNKSKGLYMTAERKLIQDILGSPPYTKEQKKEAVSIRKSFKNKIKSSKK